MAVQQQARLQRGAGDRSLAWRRGLPLLTDGRAILRELRASDAASLLAHLNDPSVLEYLTPSPSTVAGFRQFIQWTHGERREGRHACFGILPIGSAAPVGIIQIWPIERDFSTAEWGFLIGRRYWGTGLFVRSASIFFDAIFMDGLFGPPGVFRLEARAVDGHGRGEAVLRKLGAVREGVLRRGFRDGHRMFDHVMWSILAPEWQSRRARESQS